MRRTAQSRILVGGSLLALLLPFVGCEGEAELTDPKRYPHESLPALLSAEDFREIQLDTAAVDPCPSGVSATVTFSERNQAFGLIVAYEEGMRATVATAATPAVDTVVALFGPEDGAGYYGALPVAVDDDSGGGVLSSLVETIDEAGRYFAVVTTAGGTGLGEVTLLVGAENCAGNDCVPACDDGDECTTDSCDPALGGCLNVPIPGCRFPEACAADDECDDGDPCNGAGTCGPQGLCLPGLPPLCDDDDACTTDSCDPALGGCVNMPIPGCSVIPGCTTDTDCPFADSCLLGVCVEGLCKATPAPDGVACDDGDTCTDNDVCSAGACVGDRRILMCDDGDPCTTDSCAPEDGCQHVPIPGCNFPDPCAADDDCDDGDPCQLALCVEGVCEVVPTHDGVECATGDLCMQGGVCVAGARVGTPLDCDDGDDCTTDFCDPATGVCVSLPIPSCEPGCLTDEDCALGDMCMVGVCLENLCEAAPAPDGMACDDGDVCTTNDLCLDGECVGSPRDCDDANDCTIDVCDPAVGCFHEPDPACD